MRQALDAQSVRHRTKLGKTSTKSTSEPLRVDLNLILVLTLVLPCLVVRSWFWTCPLIFCVSPEPLTITAQKAQKTQGAQGSLQLGPGPGMMMRMKMGMVRWQGLCAGARTVPASSLVMHATRWPRKPREKQRRLA